MLGTAQTVQCQLMSVSQVMAQERLTVGFTAVSGCNTAAYHLRWLRNSAHPVESRRG